MLASDKRPGDLVTYRVPESLMGMTTPVELSYSLMMLAGSFGLEFEALATDVVCCRVLRP